MGLLFQYRGESVAYDPSLASPAVSCMSCSSDLNDFRDGRYYLPTPPLGQDMTQGQFLSGV